MKKYNIYVDNASTTSIDTSVLLAMYPYLKYLYGNPSSSHTEGVQANMGIHDARNQVATSINACFDEIYFTGSASEANNWAIRSIAYQLRQKGKGNHIITSCIEHPSILKVCKQLEKEGFEVTYLAVDKKGLISLKQLEQQIKKNTILISIMMVNNEIGVIQPISHISQIAKKHNIIMHTDATQAIGNIKVDIKELQVDLMSFTAHKFYGPKGIGGLYINYDLLPFEPLIYGGHQESGLRAGTENVASIIGMGQAIITATSSLKHNVTHVIALREFFIRELFKKAKSNNIKFTVNTSFKINSNYMIPNIISLRFLHADIDGTTLLMQLDKKGIYASSGSACSTGILEPSYVLKAIGLSDKEAYESIRISIGKHNTKKQMKILAKELINSVKEILKEIDE